MNFDRVATIYDATRRVPPEVREWRADRIVAATQAGSETRFLELGVGTGRIAMPLIERGYRYTGVDISRQMMEELRAKLPGGASQVTLLEADVAGLPFAPDSFDVVLVFHVLHLVPDWRAVLREMQRVLRPGGFFIMGGDRPVEGDPAAEIREEWRARVRALGVELRERENPTENVLAILTAEGWRSSIYRKTAREEGFPPIWLIEAQQARTFSESWTVPDEVLEAVHPQMLRWAGEQYGDIRAPLTTVLESILSVNRSPG